IALVAADIPADRRVARRYSRRDPPGHGPSGHHSKCVCHKLYTRHQPSSDDRPHPSQTHAGLQLQDQLVEHPRHALGHLPLQDRLTALAALEKGSSYPPDFNSSSRSLNARIRLRIAAARSNSSSFAAAFISNSSRRLCCSTASSASGYSVEGSAASVNCLGSAYASAYSSFNTAL